MRRLALAVSVFSLAIGVAQAGELVLGNPIELSGSNAAVGTGIARGILLAADQINARHQLGPDTVKILQEDNASDRTQGLTLVNRFALGDKVLALIGPVSTVVALPAAARANDLGVPMLTGSYAGSVLNAGPWIYKFTETSENLMAAMAQYAVEKIRPKSCAVAFVRDNEGYVALKTTFVARARAGGITIPAEESVLSSDTDYTAVATRIVAAKPDCLQIDMPTEAGANMVVQARAAGLPASAVIIAGSAQASPQFTRTGGAAVEGAYVFSDYAPGGVNDLGRDFERIYRAKFHEAPDNWAAAGWAAMQLMAEAIRHAQPDPTREKLRDALAATKDVPTILGKGHVSFDDKKVPHYGASILRVKDGQFVRADGG